MPTYSIPAPRPNTQSTDEWADLAKAFMTQPGFAQNYIDQASRVPGGEPSLADTVAGPLPEGTDWLTYTNQNATRNMGLSSDLVQALSFLPEMGITANVYSGGQPGIGSGGNRVGSTRHDHGGAGDFYLTHNGEMLSHANPAHIPILQEVVRRAKGAGITGIGMGPGYMGDHGIHMGYGAPAVWGAEGASANAPDWLRSAYYG